MNECNKHGCQKIGVKVHPSVTLSDNYDILQNKPSINGVELSRDKTAEELSLLSNKSDEYKEVSLGADNVGSFLLLLTESGETNKMNINELTKSNFHTVNQLPANLQVGNYIFLLMEDFNNGTDNK